MIRAFRIIENRPEWRQFWKKEWYAALEKRISEIEYYISAGKIDEAKKYPVLSLKVIIRDIRAYIYAGALV